MLKKLISKFKVVKQSSNQSRKAQGFAAEAVAERYLKKQGFQLVKRRFWTQGKKRFEIDLIVKDMKQDLLLFVEVRSTRKEASYPLQSITNQKLAGIHQAANAFLMQHKAYRDYLLRVDLIVVSDMKTLDNYYNE